MADKTKSNNRKNGKLSLRPLKFEEAVKDLLKVKPVTDSQLQKKNNE